MRRLSGLVLLLALLSGCAAPGAAEHDHHVTTPTIDVDGAMPASYGGTLLNAPMPENILQMVMTDHTGRMFKLADYANKTVVFTNFLTSCQHVGPLTSTNIRAAARALDDSAMKDRVIFIEVTVDAAIDLPERLAAYHQVFGFTSNVVLATAAEKDLETLWNFFGAPATRYELSPQEIKDNPRDWQTGAPSKFHWMHANIVALIDENSTWRWLQSGTPDIEMHELPQEMQNYLSAEGVTLSQTHDEFSWRVSQVVSAIEDVMGHGINS